MLVCQIHFLYIFVDELLVLCFVLFTSTCRIHVFKNEVKSHQLRNGGRDLYDAIGDTEVNLMH